MIKQEDSLGGYPYNSYVAVYDEAKSNAHPYWIGDVPVPQQILKFYNELKHKRPDMVIRLDKRPAYYNGKGYRVFAELGIAYKEAPDMNVGHIGIEAGAQMAELLYVVESKRITNDKYATHSEGYHVKKTKAFPNAVKNGLQYLKPVMFDELLTEKEGVADTAIHTIRYPAEDKLHTAGTVGRANVLAEIRNMIRVGYEPVTAKFLETMHLLAAEDEELQRVANYKPRKCFVWAKPDRVEYQVEGNERVIVYSINDVPEEIRNKVAVLQIGSATGIMDVGVKVSDTMYWVFL
jgi:hypothetical protein